MKTIYDEALQELKYATTDLKDLEIIHSYDVSKIEKALKQAQKQEKLLKLYRYLNENTNDYDLHFELVDEIDNKIEELEKQIKEIENEKI